MPNPKDQGPLISIGMSFNAQELRHLIGTANDLVADLVSAHLVRPGPVVLSRNGALDELWRVHDDDADEILAVQARPGRGASYPACATLITPDGRVARFDPLPDDEQIVPFSDAADAVPNDGNWYSVVVRASEVTSGRGTLTVTSGGTTVTGEGTTFSRLSPATEYTGLPASDIPFPSVIVVAGTASNDGSYTVASVTTDTEIEVEDTFTADETIPPANWYVKGRRLDTAYPDPADHLQRLDVTFEVMARVNTPVDGDFVLADVKNDGGTLRIVDRRAGSCAQLGHTLAPRAAGHLPIPRLAVDTASPFTAITREQVEVDNALSDAVSVAAAPTSSGQVLMVTIDTGTTDLNAYRSERPFTFGSGVAIDTGVSTAHVAPLPAGTGLTHLCVYEKSGVFYASTTDDDGDTWTTGAIIWDPTDVDAADTVQDPWILVAHTGRILVYGSYRDNTIGRRAIRVVYSDDYLDSWEIGDGTGASVASHLSQNCLRPTAVQDRRGRYLLAWDQNASPQAISCKVVTAGEGISFSGATSWSTVAPTGNAGNYRPVLLAGAGEGALLLWLNAHVAVGPIEARRLYGAVLDEAPLVSALDLLFYLDDAAGTAGSNGLGACYLPGGELAVVFESPGPSYPAVTRCVVPLVAGPLGFSG